MLKRSVLIIGLALALILGVPPQGQARPSQKPLSIENAARATAPSIKIIPRPDGKFLLEALTPPPKALVIPPSAPTQKGERSVPIPPTSQKFNAYTSWDIGRLVLSKVRSARYVWGSSLETGTATDCSGFTKYIYRMCNIDLPRTSAEQARVGHEVTRQLDYSKLAPGDLLFFRDGGRAVGHTGIYVGDGKMVHATSNAGGVVVSELDRGYYVNNFVVAKRVSEKTYKWASFHGLSPAVRYRNWDKAGVTPAPLPRPMPVIPSKLLKIFWPGKYQDREPQV